MCGIAGLWRFDGGSERELAATARAMTAAIAHRGPDGDGHWFDVGAGVALGHRRLAIIDLSPTGYQPMHSADGRFVITYNGELYNRAEMAAELGVNWRGTSDTEVLVEAVAHFGIDGALERANGLFAFAVYDTRNQVLHLARDRLGIKPLYYTRQAGLFAFASELRSLHAIAGLELTIDLGVAASYLRYGCVPAPRCIYCDVAKLLPGCRLEVTRAGQTSRTYWDHAAIAQATQRTLDCRPDDDIDQELHELLFDAVKRQMVSDVPLGAFLSGGIDSSTVVALMQRASPRPVRTFSIGFNEAGFNEAADASKVAAHLGTDHTELILTAADALALIPKLPAIYDEPFADSSQLPTYLVSTLARQHVTVALSGDGGDETFAGYVRYLGVDQLWRAARYVPPPLRRAAAAAIELLSADAWDEIAKPLPQRWKPTHVGDKILKGAAALAQDGPLGMYRRLTSLTPQPEQFLIGAREAPDALARLGDQTAGLDTVSQLRLLDMLTYLPDDILTKVDRASMAVGLEVRVPLIDHRVVEFAWRLSSNKLIANGKGKRPLRAVLDRYVPRALVERPKMGFGIPLARWLRGPLRSWAEDLLAPSALADGLFDPVRVRRCFDDCMSGSGREINALWAVLQFQAWRQAYAGGLRAGGSQSIKIGSI
jgi:asparagine synthase (glutamine-hydrolysing)